MKKISIIICSKKGVIAQQLKNNIDSTIGYDNYEIVVIDNHNNKFNLFSAYNKGIALSSGEILCFMHEDVAYYSKNWGVAILEHFKRENVGCIGIVGSHFLPDTPCGWYHPLLYSGGCMQYQNGTCVEKRNLTRFGGNNYVESVAVDGMWFCMKASFFKNHKFDSYSYSGYHFYDLDICMQVISAGLSVNIISDIIISHKSYGNFNKEWVSDASIFHTKWKSFLPIVSGASITIDEINIRTQFVKQAMIWIEAYAGISSELANVRNSMSYKIGKVITRIAHKIEKIIKGK